MFVNIETGRESCSESADNVTSETRFIVISECKYVRVSAEVLPMHYARNM